MPSRRATALGVGLLALLGVFGAAFVVRVAPGDLALVDWRGGGTPDLRSPGYSLRIPWLQRVETYPQGAVQVAAALTVPSREGASVEVPYVLKARPDRQ